MMAVLRARGTVLSGAVGGFLNKYEPDQRVSNRNEQLEQAFVDRGGQGGHW